MSLKIHLKLICISITAFNSTYASVPQKEFFDIRQKLLNVIATTPDSFVWETIGKSEGGLPIDAVTVVPRESKKLSYLIIGAHHGNEPMTFEVAIEAIYQLLSLQRSKNKQFIFIPCLNPDGLIKGTRLNDRGVDLNRNYPTSASRESVRIENETMAMINYLNRINPDIVLSLHTGTKAIFYPWGHTPKPPKSLKQLDSIAHYIAKEMNIKTVKSSFFDYKTKGELIDYSYEAFGIPSFTVEFSNEHQKKKSKHRQFIKKTSKKLIDSLLKYKAHENSPTS